MARPLGPVPEHGTRQRYQLRGDPCRCLRCRAANKSYVTDRRLARRAQRVAAPINPIAARNRKAWEQVKLPPEYMVKCGHSEMEGRDKCAWCGTPMRQAG